MLSSGLALPSISTTLFLRVDIFSIICLHDNCLDLGMNLGAPFTHFGVIFLFLVLGVWLCSSGPFLAFWSFIDSWFLLLFDAGCPKSMAPNQFSSNFGFFLLFEFLAVFPSSSIVSFGGKFCPHSPLLLRYLWP